MNISTRALTEAREVTEALLEQLGLETYVFGVEPRDGEWEVRIDCANGEGWQSVTLNIDVARLVRTHSDGALRAQLLEEWRRQLATCRRTALGPETEKRSPP